MQWRKLGRIFVPSGEKPWMRSHATAPIPLRVEGDRWRIFFSSRDALQRSHVGWFEVRFNDPSTVRRIASGPVLAPGSTGQFDADGVYAFSLVPMGRELWLYYVGWVRGAKPPLFSAAIGLAVSRDGGLHFRKYGPAPIIDRGPHDPCLVAALCCRIERRRWRMWYTSGIRWEEDRDGLHSVYHIKYSESRDGIHWRRDGRVCIALKRGERNVAHPWVLHESGGYRMWYSRNTALGYRIGYAESRDGLCWTRRDESVGIDVAPRGWDSADISHPAVLEDNGRRYLLYNGNRFGRDGIGLAVEASASR